MRKRYARRFASVLTTPFAPMREHALDSIITELTSRLRGIVSDLAEGQDIPPSRSLRLEGMLEAAVLTGTASAAELDVLLETCYRDGMGRTLTDELGENWREVYPFPELPLRMPRAPVYPSTPD